MDERILTKHPQGKAGVNISRAKYDVVKEVIINLLNENGEMTFQGLGEAVQQQLEGNFEGSISWYYTTVKLDLEARGIVARIPGSSPQRLRLGN